MYVNDIIIYSLNLKSHLIHLNQILNILDHSEVTLFLSKCYFAYSLIKALEHHVSWLKLSIFNKKIKAVRNMTFSKTLRKLKIELRFFNYYRKFVSHYAAIIRSFIALKTWEFKNSSFKEQARKKHAERISLKEKLEAELKRIEVDKQCHKTWNTLKEKLCSAFTLVFSNFHKSFILYTNESKEKNYDATLHQKEKNDVKRSILFLFKDLNSTKIRY